MRRNFILLPLLLILPLIVLSETSQPNKFSECIISPFDHCRGLPYFETFWDISYPFREPSMPDHCGLPGFDVTCKNNNTDSAMLVLEIDNKEYKVSNISYEDQTINLVDTEYLLGDPCHLHLTNTTFNRSLFNYTANDLNLTLHFNCSPDASSSTPNDVSLSLSSHLIPSCQLGSNLHDLYYSLPEGDPSLLAEILRICNSYALIPIWNEPKHQQQGGIDFWGAIHHGFYLNWTSDDTRWCKGCEATGGACLRELIKSPGKPLCSCSDGSITNGTCNTKGKRKKTKIIIEAGSAAMLGFLLACLSLALYFYKHGMVSKSFIFQKKNLNDDKKIEAFLEEYESIFPRRYSYSNVKKITKAFQEKLGQGGYGTVFKGTLDSGHMVAVKILNDSKGDGEEFVNEVASIGRTSHVNVVNLLGFCYEGSKRALIYEFMRNGSLEKLLYSEMPKTTSDWEKLYRIAIGIARGLEYLHRGCNTRIVHFDIKPHNILLDQDFCPKISDFGLAKLCLKKESIISIAGARGTIGYIAPEVFSRNFGVVSSKSDVYSYGMMVLEIAGGRKNPNEGVQNSSETYFPHWIYARLDQNGDLLSCGVTAESEELARKMILVGLWCIQTMPENRPSMSRVIEMMEGGVDDLQIPPKPYLSSSPFGSIVGTSSIQDVCYTTLTIAQPQQTLQDVSATKSLLKP